MKGTIFDIKEFSIHDGPGGRVTVFLKGCPLRCTWCHNPEGLSSKPQLMYKKNLCTHCGSCKIPCNHSVCIDFEKCVYSCPNGCLSVAGKTIESWELAEKIKGYKDFFEITDGGVTFSGGEPLMQGEFLLDVLSELDGIHTAIQTSGFADYKLYKKIIDRVDYVMQDIKIADSDLHKKYTGVDNAVILKNIEYLKNSGKEFVFRIPLIPDITDTEENLIKISRITENHPVELLKYNTMAGAKYEMLNMKYSLKSQPNEEIDYTKYFQNAKMR